MAETRVTREDLLNSIPDNDGKGAEEDDVTTSPLTVERVPMTRSKSKKNKKQALTINFDE